MSKKKLCNLDYCPQEEVAYIRYCALCGEVFNVDLHEIRTICPTCRIAWRKIRDEALFKEVTNND